MSDQYLEAKIRNISKKTQFPSQSPFLLSPTFLSPDKNPNPSLFLQLISSGEQKNTEDKQKVQIIFKNIKEERNNSAKQFLCVAKFISLGT